MAKYKSDVCGPLKPAVTPVGNEPVVRRATVTLPAATKLTDGDILDLCVIPAGCVVLSVVPFSGDLDDGTAALVFDLGLMDEGDAALDTVFFSGLTLGQAGGVLDLPTTTPMFTTAPAATDKVLAIEVTTTANGDTAAEAKVGAVVTYAQVA